MIPRCVGTHATVGQSDPRKARIQSGTTGRPHLPSARRLTLRIPAGDSYPYALIVPDAPREVFGALPWVFTANGPGRATVKSDQDSEVHRRRLLTSVPAVVGALLVDGVSLRGELLDLAADDLDRLWRSWRADGAPAIARPVSMLAHNLAGIAQTTPAGSADRRRAALLTARAAQLAGIVALDADEPAATLEWFKVQIRAGRQANEPGNVAMGLDWCAWVHLTVLDEPGKAFAIHDQIRLDEAPAVVRGLVELRRAEMLAKVGRESAAWKAFDRGLTTAVDGPDDGGPVILSVTDSVIEVFTGRVKLELGHADLAYPSLRRVLATKPGYVRVGQPEFDLARAAAGMGEPDQACQHLVQAHHAWTRHGSALGLRRVRLLADQLGELFGNVRAVRELPEQLRGDSRYVLCRTDTDGTRVHLRTCRYAGRGRARPWPAAEHLAPGELVNSEIRAGHELCTRCLPV